MLQEVYRRRYQEFTDLLSLMRQSLEAKDGLLIKQAEQAVQEFFSREILLLPVDELPESIQSKARAYQTEIHKELRLLAMDVMFLGVSRSKATIESRLSGVGERITLLQRYCEAVLSF